MFFFILGMRPRTQSVEGGIRKVRMCPVCGRQRTFVEARVRNYLELFFIPVIPLGSGRRALVCEHCKSPLPVEDGGIRAADGTWVGTRGEWREAGDTEAASTGGATRAGKPRMVHCIHCGTKILAEDRPGTQSATCPNCGKSFTFGV